MGHKNSAGGSFSSFSSLDRGSSRLISEEGDENNDDDGEMKEGEDEDEDGALFPRRNDKNGDWDEGENEKERSEGCKESTCVEVEVEVD